MEKKCKKDNDIDVLSTKLDCLNNRLNRMQNDYDSTLAYLMISVRENEVERKVEKEVKESEEDSDLLAKKWLLFASKCFIVFIMLSLGFVILGEVVKSVIHCFI